MNVVICSAFRNAAATIDRYFDQINGLDCLLTRRGDYLSLVLGYGDSTDDTATLLFEHTSGGIGARLIDVSHGGPEFGPVVDAQRFRQLAYIGNKIFWNVPRDADAVIWCESDLSFVAQTIMALIDHLTAYPVIAPMIMERSTGGFYDLYAFRKDGVRFQKHQPYHPSFVDGLIQMDSVGSLVAMRGDIPQRFTVPEDTVIVGFCNKIRAEGLGVWLDSRLSVEHP